MEGMVQQPEAHLPMLQQFCRKTLMRHNASPHIPQTLYSQPKSIPKSSVWGCFAHIWILSLQVHLPLNEASLRQAGLVQTL